MRFFRPLERRRTFDEIATRIRDSLIAGQLAPGDKLPAERELAQQFGVSRPALREALRTLEIAGVLELKKGRNGGAFVSKGNPRIVSDYMSDLLRLGSISIEDLIEARVWIEEVIVRVACDRATKDDLQALEENARQAADLFERGFLVEKTDVNIEFHNVLAKATKNPVLVMITRSITDVFRYFAQRIGPETTRATLGSRRRFLDALRARDADRAVAEMNKTLMHVLHRYRSIAKDMRTRDVHDDSQTSAPPSTSEAAPPKKSKSPRRKASPARTT